MPTVVQNQLTHRSLLPSLFAGLAGAFLGLTVLKFGNPVILDWLVERPSGLLQLMIQPWPIAWGYAIGIVVALAGLPLAWSRTRLPHWLVLLPYAWLLWQFVVVRYSIEPRLTVATLPHFLVVVAGFYLGLFALARVHNLWPFWIGLLVGLLAAVWAGFGQHYGGLEATRQYIYTYYDWRTLPAEHLKRIGSNRVFGTLLYPNAFAGVLLLLLPVCLVTVWRLCSRCSPLVQKVLTGLVAYAGVACLVWSGSKAGWLIALTIICLICLLQIGLSQRIRLLAVGLVVVLGVTAFFVKFSGYFAKGATSVGARMSYWGAAWQTAKSHPWFGAGPGTFAVYYAKLKPPEAEMTRLAHNDYLQQASDSGWLGCGLYGVFVIGSLAVLYKKSPADPVRFSVWVGLLAWALHSFVEFGLYIPALGWTAFWLFGWLWGLPLTPGEDVVDKPSRRPYAPANG
jgi:O-antigen ligase